MRDKHVEDTDRRARAPTPFNVSFMDEIEKMDPRVRDVTLSVADGSVTNRYANKISTALTILIVTTNTGWKRETKG